MNAKIHKMARRASSTIGALDLGASGGKVFAARMNGSVIGFCEIYRFPNSPTVFHTPIMGNVELNSWHCWDLGRIYGEILTGLKQLGRFAEGDLASFGIDTWGSDIGWLDRAGRVMDYIATGRDPRWLKAQADILSTIPAAELFKRTGIHTYPFNQINQLYWYVANCHGFVEDAEMFLPFNSVLAYLLTGVKFAEYTCLSISQLLEAGRPKYNKWILAKLSLPSRILPPLIDPGEPVGTIHKELAEHLEIASTEYVAPATHDTACAFASVSDSPQTRSVIISSGTWYLIGTNVKAPMLSPEAFQLGFSSEGGAGCVNLLKNVMGSWPLQALRRKWGGNGGDEIPWSDMSDMALSVTRFKRIIDIDHPVFYSPSDMEEALQQYCDEHSLPRFCNRPEMVAALYEGLAIKVAIVVNQLRDLVAREFDEIAIVGGGVRNAVLNQWIADASELPVRTGCSDGTALGNILIQAKALGWIKSLEEGRKTVRTDERVRHYKPSPDIQWRKALKIVMEHTRGISMR